MAAGISQKVENGLLFGDLFVPSVVAPDANLIDIGDLPADFAISDYSYVSGVLQKTQIVASPPDFVSDLQFRLALNELGLRTATENYIASADQDVKDWWDRALTIERSNKFLQQAQKALGKTQEEFDDVIRLAATK